MIRITTIIILLTLPLLTIGQSSSGEYSSLLEKHRENFKNDFLTKERSPLDSSDLKYLSFYDANEDYVITGEIKLTPDSPIVEIPTYSGNKKPFKKYFILTFEINGIEESISAYQNMRLIDKPEYKDYLFVPFKDDTNGDSTYGGGRYINLKMSDIKDGKIVLDFNKSYNPWCAYSDGFNCPIPPLENHLSMEILAGEKNFLAKKKKRAE